MERLLRGAAGHFRQSGGGHGCRRAAFGLAASFGAGHSGVLNDDLPYGRRRKDAPEHLFFSAVQFFGTRDQGRRQDAAGTRRGRCADPPHGGVALRAGQGPHHSPVGCFAGQCLSAVLVRLHFSVFSADQTPHRSSFAGISGGALHHPKRQRRFLQNLFSGGFGLIYFVQKGGFPKGNILFPADGQQFFSVVIHRFHPPLPVECS